MASSMMHVRVDDELKAQANEVLSSMGLTLSEGTRVFLHHLVAEQGMPFALKVPNRQTREALAEAQTMIDQKTTI